MSQIINYTNGGLVTYSQDTSISLYSLKNLCHLEDYARKLKCDPERFDSIEEIEQLKMVIAPTFDMSFLEKNEGIENKIVDHESNNEEEETTIENMCPTKESFEESPNKEIDSGSIPIIDNIEKKEIDLGSIAIIDNIEKKDLDQVKKSDINKENAIFENEEQSLLKKFQKVSENLHILDSIDPHVPKLIIPQEELLRFVDDTDGHFLLKKTWKKDVNGGLELIDKSIVEGQKKVLSHVLKSMGRNILEGKSVMNISLPIIIFSNESILQRAASSLVYAPIFLEKAGKISDYLERIKYTITFFFTSLHCAIEQLKPFNPILGIIIKFIQI